MPIRATAAEQILTDERVAGKALDEAANQAAAATTPPSDVHASAAFRKKLARHVTREALETAAQRAGRT